MPIFEFRCKHCQKQFEVLAPLENEPSCPDCGNSEVLRIPSRFSMCRGLPSYDEKKDTLLTLKELESKGELGKLGKDDIKFYQDYVKCH